MPLETIIFRDEKPLEINWGGFHVACMIMATIVETKPDWCKDFDIPAHATQLCGPGDVFQLMDYTVIGATELNKGDYTLKEDHSFWDPVDGEIFELKAGDKFRVYRSFR